MATSSPKSTGTKTFSSADSISGTKMELEKSADKQEMVKSMANGKTFTHAVCWHQGLSAKWGYQFRRRCGLRRLGNVSVPIWKMAMDGIVNMMKI